MALKKSVSTLFKKKSSRGIEYSQPAGSSSSGPLRNIQEDQDDELQVAIQASIESELENSRRQIQQLEAELSKTKQERDGMTQGRPSVRNDAALSNEAAGLKGIIASLTEDNRSREKYFEHCQREFSQQLQTAERKLKDLSFNNDMFKASNDLQRAELQTKTEALQAMEERLSWAERDSREASGNDFLRLQGALRKENQSLRNQVQRFGQEKKKMLAYLQKQRTEMAKSNAAFEAQMAQVIAERDDAQQALNAVATVSQDLEGFQSHFTNTTPRSLLMMKASGNRAAPLATRDSQCARFRETSAVQHLSHASLDLPLTISEANNFLESLNRNQDANLLQSLTLKVCALCKVPKFAKLSSGNFIAERLNEFSGQTGCCSESICSNCFPAAIFKAIENDWWHNLDSQAWIQCPVPGCQELTTVKGVGELEVILYRLGVEQLSTHLEKYEKATILRSALQKLSSQPSVEVLTIASNLHKQLIARNRMYDYFDPRFNSSIPDEHGRMPELNPGNLLLADIDQGDQTIPIFTRFFRRTATPRECSICADTRYELDFDSVDEWMQSCEGFHGSWMWNVLLFPTRYSLECDHDMDACKACVATHLSTQLEEYGVNGCDRLSCLTCNRRLTHREVKLHATPEAFQKYDRFHLLKLLSAEPNFRWCLRESCTSGQLYENTEYLDPQIICEECEFEMCFTHQTPWHSDLTCAQFDSQREHGDPDFHDTQEWLREHTKPCPGCQVDVEKNAGCFHMTCRACRHEFCWTCLADWNVINPEPGTYRRDAHNEGCFFRTSNVQPTAIQGNDLQAALGGRT